MFSVRNKAMAIGTSFKTPKFYARKKKNGKKEGKNTFLEEAERLRDNLEYLKDQRMFLPPPMPKRTKRGTGRSGNSNNLVATIARHLPPKKLAEECL